MVFEDQEISIANIWAECEFIKISKFLFLTGTQKMPYIAIQWECLCAWMWNHERKSSSPDVMHMTVTSFKYMILWRLSSGSWHWAVLVDANVLHFWSEGLYPSWHWSYWVKKWLCFVNNLQGRWPFWYHRRGKKEASPGQ